MLNERIKNKILEIETKSEYDDLMNSFVLSDAPLELKQEAIKELKKAHILFDDERHTTPKEVLQMIKDGEADTSDINGY
jgi:replicative DNA helicase